ncbi:Acid-sensing ion channel 4-A [Dissostichus eleginoides]|nr:Acid-sensing ion channel 4-A [Dissostichus eleginoides]
MPIEFVCKIKFAEEDEKQKNKQDGDKESLIEESCTPPVKDLAGFANSSSLHGINHIFVSGRLGIRQTLWALAFLTSLALFLYHAAKCAISYLEHPHITSLNEEATPEMVFPAVTICNINRFRFSALTDADIYHLANLTGLPPKNKDGHKPHDLMYPAPDMQDIFNRTGHQLDEMLKSCNFSGQNCSAEDFSVPFTWRRNIACDAKENVSSEELKSLTKFSLSNDMALKGAEMIEQHEMTHSFFRVEDGED